MPVITCPHCRTAVDIHPDDAGYKVLCPNCHSAFQAGDSERLAPPPPDRNPAPPDPRALTVHCTACRAKVEIGADDVGHLMECPLCGEKFRAEEEGRSRSDSWRDSERRPSRSRYASDDPRDEDDDDEDDRDDRRHRRRYRQEDKGYILESARATIAWPANGLMWTGIVCSVLCLLISLGLGLAGAVAMDEPDPYGQQKYVPFFIYAGLIAFGVPYHIVLAVAGHQMKKLRGSGWAYTGAALGIATILFTGMCSPTTWACMTFGIWALVACSRREVQDAIRINTGRS